MVYTQGLPGMLRDEISQLRMDILAVFCKLIKYSLSLLISLAVPSLTKSLINIIPPAFGSQVSSIYPKMILATLPYGSRKMLLYCRVNPRMASLVKSSTSFSPLSFNPPMNRSHESPLSDQDLSNPGTWRCPSESIPIAI